MRIISLLPAATEVLFTLGAGDRIVAVSHECNYPSDALIKPRVTRSRIRAAASSAAIDEEVKSAIASGEPLYKLDEDLIERLKPDLIITQAQCDVCAVRYEYVVDLCKRAHGLRHTDILTLNPASLGEVVSDVERIGIAAKVPAEATELVAQLSKRVSKVRELAKVRPIQPRVVVVEWIEPLMVAGNWTPELVQIAGGLNGLSVAGGHSTYHSWNEIAAFDPEVIIVAPCGFDLTRALDEMPVLAKHTQWRRTSAVRTGRVFAVDGDAYFNRPGPRLIDSLEMLAAHLHPDMFSGPDDTICRRWSP